MRSHREHVYFKKKRGVSVGSKLVEQVIGAGR